MLSVECINLLQKIYFCSLIVSCVPSHTKCIYFHWYNLSDFFFFSNSKKYKWEAKNNEVFWESVFILEGQLFDYRLFLFLSVICPWELYIIYMLLNMSTESLPYSRRKNDKFPWQQLRWVTFSNYVNCGDSAQYLAWLGTNHHATPHLQIHIITESLY